MVSKGLNATLQSEDVLELLSTDEQIDTIYGDEKLVPLGNWAGKVGKLVSIIFV